MWLRACPCPLWTSISLETGQDDPRDRGPARSPAVLLGLLHMLSAPRSVLPLGLCPPVLLPHLPAPNPEHGQCPVPSPGFIGGNLKNKDEKVMCPRPPRRDPGGRAETRAGPPIRTHAPRDAPRDTPRCPSAANVAVSSACRSAFCSFHALVSHRTKPGHRKGNRVLVSGPACPIS